MTVNTQNANSASFGERLLTRRNEIGWTQKKLALESKVSARSISDYELGKTPQGPTLEQLKSLAKALGVSVGWLVGDQITFKRSEIQTDRICRALRMLRGQLTNMVEQLQFYEDEFSDPSKLVRSLAKEFVDKVADHVPGWEERPPGESRLGAQGERRAGGAEAGRGVAGEDR